VEIYGWTLDWPAVQYHLADHTTPHLRQAGGVRESRPGSGYTPCYTNHCDGVRATGAHCCILLGFCSRSRKDTWFACLVFWFSGAASRACVLLGHHVRDLRSNLCSRIAVITHTMSHLLSAMFGISRTLFSAHMERIGRFYPDFIPCRVFFRVNEAAIACPSLIQCDEPQSLV
jgi:hypothetical protein